MIWFRLEACLKCAGDLALDDGDWICLQCGTYYYTDLYQSPPASFSPPPSDHRSDQSNQHTEFDGAPGKSVAGWEFPTPTSLAANPADLL